MLRARRCVHAALLLALVSPACAGDPDGSGPGGSGPGGGDGSGADGVAPAGRYDLEATETHATPCPPFDSTADLTFELSGGAGALQISSDDPDVGSLGARIASGEIPELGVVAEEPVLVVSADLSWGAYQGLPIAAEVTYLLEVAAGGEVAGLAATSFHWDEEEGGGTRCDYEWEVSGQVTAP